MSLILPFVALAGFSLSYALWVLPKAASPDDIFAARMIGVHGMSVLVAIAVLDSLLR
jgi:hypothetical protein